MEATKKPFAIDFTDVSGGVNSVEHPLQFGPTQVHPDTIGCMLKKSGIVKYPGARGLTDQATFEDYLRMLVTHRQYDTTESLYALSGGVLSLVDKTTGLLTDKYTMGLAAGEGWACEAFGKLWAANGQSVVKVEGTTAYQVGISAPVGVTAVAGAGAGLPDGVYSVYAGYARSVGGVNKLYGQGQFVASITLGSGNNQISVTSFPNSSDPQVNNKVLWVKSPSEVIHYFFYDTGNNTTTTFAVSATTEKNLTVPYETYALDNGRPPAGTFIYAFANRLWLIKDNVIYYSSKGYTEYDLEVFPARNYRITPYKLTGIFSIGQNLYFNTESGILVLPGADIAAQDYLIEPRWHFEYMRTVAQWNNGVIGLTNDGVRLFNGERFTDYDVSVPIKTRVHTAYGASADALPCGFVYRRDYRNEYHLLWQDPAISTASNNVHAVLNLDSMVWASADQYRFAWEFQPISGNYAVVSRNDNVAYIGQSHESASKIYQEDATNLQLKDVFGAGGEVISVDADYSMVLRMRSHMQGINGVMWVGPFFYVMAQNDYPFTIQFFSGDDPNVYTPEYTVTTVGGVTAVWESATFDENTFPYETVVPQRGKFPESFRCRSLYAVVRQSANDQNFKLLQLNVQGMFEAGRFL